MMPATCHCAAATEMTKAPPPEGGPKAGSVLELLEKISKGGSTMNERSATNVRSAGFRRRAVALALTSALGISGAAQAFEIETGNEDISMRWDNTIRYNAGLRAQKQNPQILGNPNYDDGDRNFANGSLVTSRFDVLSEFDFIY